ncbi:protein of unknown function DUF105 [Ignisphaera aggregans DSM 17230]|uniref:YutG/PgpA domain-containing protein n=1 Tax=Ignisphaera aggregans (strain DSM 17230 / JCM 13409 / AQ1.S1) TaxID=583356 RepID=E0SR27_IGNAA|nr:protein of unknown function DUF105 [Ignisphaera aggregans DSM 17230]
MKIEYIDNNTILIRLPNPMKILSTVYIVSSNGYVENIVFRFVSKDFYVENLVDYYKSIAREISIENAVIFITATSIENFIHTRIDEIDTDIFMTIGLEPAVCIETKVFKPITISTINIAVVIRQPLTDNAMVDLLRTITEAKCLASSDIMLRCRTRSSGTVTDAIAVLKPLDIGEEILFAGMATTIGNTIARAVHRAIVSKALDRKNMFSYLTGLSEEEFLDLFRELYRYMPIPNISDEKAIEIVKMLLHKILSDPNTWSFIVAARELDLHGLVGTIPNISLEEFARDSPRIIADEIIGMALAMYIAGIKGLFSMYWVERLKEKNILSHNVLGVFEDDVISALLGSLYTLLYEYIQGGTIDV